jgi:hypothetical protein
MKIEYKFSATDIDEILKLLNVFLKHISMVTFSRSEVELADPKKRLPGSGNSKYSDIVKVINRWGIKDGEGKYYELLNDVICKISSSRPMLQIYKPIELLLFNKLLESRMGGRTEFTKEEIEIFFLQPYKMIVISYIPVSAVCLYDSIGSSQKLSVKLKSKDAKDFIAEGVGRRLFMLKATVDSISEIYCESRIKFLDDNEKAIISQNINFFYANIYAILDCLAFVFAFEHPNYEIDRNKKSQLQKVGLFKESFYTKINGLCDKLNLTKVKPWYDGIVNLRHPVAHRIPLYFPEIYNGEDSLRIQEAEKKYYKRYNAILENMTPNDENAQLEKLDQIKKLDEELQETRANINVFSGCFLHSHEESEKYYHLSRLTLDVGILYYLLDESFEYLFALCG